MAADVIQHMHSAPASLANFDGQASLHFKLPKTNTLGAFLMIVKAIVGVGLFVLPWAFKTMGIGSSMIAMVILAWLTYYAGIVLLRVRDVVVRDTLKRDLTYVSLAEHCFGKSAGWVVYVLIVFTTIGSCGAYLVFIGQVMKSLLPQLSVQAWAGFTALAVLPFCLARSTSFLAYTSILGNVGVVLVVILVFARGAQLAEYRAASEYVAFNSPAFMQAFGIIGFVFSCSSALLTIEKAMAKRAEFNKIFKLALLLVFVICAVFATVNYIYYGDDTCSIIVLNLGSGPLAAIAKIAIAVDLAFTYPMTIAPAREIIEKSLLHDGVSKLRLKQTAIRVTMVAITFLLCFFPQMGIIVNIVGGWSVAALTFCLPCLMLLQLRRFHLLAFNKQMEFMRQEGMLPGTDPTSASASPHAFRRSSQVLSKVEHSKSLLLVHDSTSTTGTSPSDEWHAKIHLDGELSSPASSNPASGYANADLPDAQLRAWSAAGCVQADARHGLGAQHDPSVLTKVQQLATSWTKPLQFHPWSAMAFHHMGSHAASGSVGDVGRDAAPQLLRETGQVDGHAELALQSVDARAARRPSPTAHARSDSIGELRAKRRPSLPTWFPVGSPPGISGGGDRRLSSLSTLDELMETFLHSTRRLSHSGAAGEPHRSGAATGGPTATSRRGSVNTTQSSVASPAGAKRGPIGHTQVEVVVHGHSLRRPRVASDVDVVSTTHTTSDSKPLPLQPLVTLHRPAAMSMVPEGDEGAASPMTNVPATEVLGSVTSTSPPQSATTAAEPNLEPSQHATGHKSPRRGSVGRAPSAGGRRLSSLFVPGTSRAVLDAIGRRHRHKQALMLLGVGNKVEAVLLGLIAMFGLVVLFMTTIQSIIDAAAVKAEPAVCSG